MVEDMLRDLAASDPRWRIAILRYFNPVGAHESGLIGEDPNGIPNNLLPYVAQVAVGKLSELSVFGNDYPTHDGTGVRDYIHVSDIARAHELALNANGKVTNQIFNLGTNAGYSVLQIIEETEKVLGQKVNFTIVNERPGDPPSLIALAHKAKELLGWEPRYNLQDIITSVYAWRNNPRY
jgi:UDP-glucose 4-epimerase